MNTIKFNCLCNNAPAYSYNKPGDNTGEYIKVSKIERNFLNLLKNLNQLTTEDNQSELMKQFTNNSPRKTYEQEVDKIIADTNKKKADLLKQRLAAESDAYVTVTKEMEAELDTKLASIFDEFDDRENMLEEDEKIGINRARNKFYSRR